MIKAKHSPIIQYFYCRHLSREIHKQFSHMHLTKLPPRIPEDRSLLITVNHTNWWDGYLSYSTACKFFKRKPFMMIDQDHFKNHNFIKQAGCFSIKPGARGFVFETFDYTASLLDDPKSMVIYYPQGKMEPFDKRPLEIRKGLKYMIHKSPNKIAILPLIIKVQSYDEKKQEACIHFGSLIRGEDALTQDDYFDRRFFRDVDYLQKQSNERRFTTDLLQAPLFSYGRILRQSWTARN